ncbi:hypothetical protein [Pseudarthrobacter sp. MEB009]|uniref:hypothetical protein n=1 Tax=Pseudarthrobacter sp. MEB009 TaxID=3040326 RepID=UPI002554AA7B|nr:hypothetical protein [Pseudarthrobacter sp. MEB009]
MAEQQACTGGNHPTNAQGITLCHHCTTRLENCLRDVADVWENLLVSAARLDVGAGSNGTSGHSTPALPCNFDAIDDGDQLEAVLRGWASHISVVNPYFTPRQIAERLLNQVKWIRRAGWAGELLQELREALNKARRTMDRSAERVFAGMCPTEIEEAECGAAVYTMPGHPEARCPRCKSVWDVTEWRVRAMFAAGLHQGTPAELSRMISDPVTGEALPQERIRQWVRRRKLTPIGVNGKGAPVYQVRKVRNLWARMKTSPFGNPTHKKQLLLAA